MIFLNFIYNNLNHLFFKFTFIGQSYKKLDKSENISTSNCIIQN